MKHFSEPTVEIIRLEVADILTTSNAEDLVHWEINDNVIYK